MGNVQRPKQARRRGFEPRMEHTDAKSATDLDGRGKLPSGAGGQ